MILVEIRLNFINKIVNKKIIKKLNVKVKKCKNYEKY